MKQISLYNRYEKMHLYLMVVVVTVIIYSILLIFLFVIKRLFVIIASSLILDILILFTFIVEMYTSTKMVVFIDKYSIEIHRKIGKQKKVNIKDIIDVHSYELEDIASSIKKGTYYSLYFKLKNGKRVRISENLHVTTLVYFLKEFLKYYKDGLPDECVKHIEEIIKEKEIIAKRFER